MNLFISKLSSVLYIAGQNFSKKSITSMCPWWTYKFFFKKSITQIQMMDFSKSPSIAFRSDGFFVNVTDDDLSIFWLRIWTRHGKLGIFAFYGSVIWALVPKLLTFKIFHNVGLDHTYGSWLHSSYSLYSRLRVSNPKIRLSW